MLLLLCALSISGSGNETTAPQGGAIKVALAEAGKTMVRAASSFNGVLAAKETVEVRSRISGYLTERLFEEGAFVQKGDVLYRLDDRDLKAGLSTAKANAAKAETTWKNDEITRSRYVPLAQKGAVSVQERDRVVTKAEESLAYYNAAKAEEEKTAVNLSYATISAPISGYADRSEVDVGGFVEAGSVLLTTMYRIDPIRVEFSISDGEFGRLKRIMDVHGGNPKAVKFILELSDERIQYPYEGFLEMADPVVDRKTNTLGVRVEFPNPNHRLRPGLYVNIQAVMGESEALTVPEVAVVDQGGGKAVYTVDGNNTLMAVPVEIGDAAGDNRIITKGLSPGQKVVVQGLVTAHPGMRVEVVAAQASASDGAAAPALPHPVSRRAREEHVQILHRQAHSGR